MSVQKRRRTRRVLAVPSLALLATTLSPAAEVHGRVTDPLGAPVAGAELALLRAGRVVASGRSNIDGTYTLHTGDKGHFTVTVVSETFREITTRSFYAGLVDSRVQNIVLAPARVNQQVVVTERALPTPQAQVSGSITKIPQPDFRNRVILADAMRQSPGTFLVQQGMYGGVISLFVRGGSSSANRVVLDGDPVENVGGFFDFIISTNASNR